MKQKSIAQNSALVSNVIVFYTGSFWLKTSDKSLRTDWLIRWNRQANLPQSKHPQKEIIGCYSEVYRVSKKRV